MVHWWYTFETFTMEIHYEIYLPLYIDTYAVPLLRPLVIHCWLCIMNTIPCVWLVHVQLQTYATFIMCVPICASLFCLYPEANVLLLVRHPQFRNNWLHMLFIQCYEHITMCMLRSNTNSYFLYIWNLCLHVCLLCFKLIMLYYDVLYIDELFNIY